MAGDQFFITKSDKPVKKGNGIAPTGNADEVATVRREIAEEFFWFNQNAPEFQLHKAKFNAQPTFARPRRDRRPTLSGRRMEAAMHKFVSGEHRLPANS